VCYTLEKQNETMNEFLDGIEANGMIHQFKNIFERSRIKYVSIQIALKQSIWPDTAIERIGHFDDDTLDAISEGASSEGLEMEIYNLEDEVMRKSRRIKSFTWCIYLTIRYTWSKEPRIDLGMIISYLAFDTLN